MKDFIKISQRPRRGPGNPQPQTGFILKILVPAILIAAMSGACSKEVKTGCRDCNEPGPANQTFSVLECGTNAASLSETPLIRWAKSPESWNSLYRALHKNQLPPPTPPAVDLDQYGVLLLYAGEFRQAGYALGVNERSVKGTTLYLEVKLEDNSETPIRAQILTTPYCLLAVDRVKVHRIELETQLDFPEKSIVLKNL